LGHVGREDEIEQKDIGCFNAGRKSNPRFSGKRVCFGVVISVAGHVPGPFMNWFKAYMAGFGF